MPYISREAYRDLMDRQAVVKPAKKIKLQKISVPVSTIKLTIPALQKTLNRLLRIHWTQFQKEQKIFDLLIHKAYIESYPNGENFRGRKVKIVYTLYFRDGKRRDLSNYGQKMIDDSLVREGIIDDDCSSIVIEESVRIRKDKANSRTEIEIIGAD